MTPRDGSLDERYWRDFWHGMIWIIAAGTLVFVILPSAVDYLFG